MGATGTANIDFGAFPGASDASVAVTGQTGIVAGSLVEAWLRPVDTADHTADEHMLESLKVFAHTIVAGTGFTISAFNTSEINEPVEPIDTYQGSETVVTTASATTIGIKFKSPSPRVATVSGSGGTGTRIYGLFTVAWAWN